MHIKKKKKLSADNWISENSNGDSIGEQSTVQAESLSQISVPEANPYHAFQSCLLNTVSLKCQKPAKSE